jgi:hypothetical protein
MAETEQTKVCPLCAETIKAAAKVCPYCRKSQKYGLFLIRQNVYALASAVLLIVMLGSVLYFYRDAFHRQRDFALDKDKIQVLNFHFDTTLTQYKTNIVETNIVVLGILTNESEHAWIADHFEIRYFDNANKILGVDDPSLNDFIILPHSDHSFCLNLYHHKAVSHYAACKVKVVSANDPEAHGN